MSNKIIKTYSLKSKGPVITASLMFVTVFVSGCSSLTRFDFPIFGLGKDENTTSSVRRDSDYDDVRRVYPPRNERNSDYDRYESDRRFRSSRFRRRELPPEPTTIIVRPGDTLYSLARKNNVQLSALKRANHLDSNLIHVGQELVIPNSQSYDNYGYSGGRRSLNRSYRTGDYRYQSRRRSGDRFASLDRNRNRPWNRTRNDRTRNDRVRPRYRTDENFNRRRRVNPKRHSVTRTPAELRRNQNSNRNSDTNYDRRRDKRVANIPENRNRVTRDVVRKTEDKINMPRTSGRFRWPARGDIISRFGIKRNGARNDGINISVAMGTDVRAAQSGEVAYAGNELKGYGNLVLIRHRNNWVTAYAHNSKILVRRGQRVRSGQVIAKAGKTGSVNRPQIHFELRRGDKPVDPLKHM